ncbi:MULTISPECIES: zinc-dependent alcohol dehydrogenase [Rhodococcus]|uniref:Threonine dehydrogenase n=1 Tax=Rhodococcus aetherivorans TaxID=191292 RepID=A0ABQ0YJM1_9NOCA|nr:MULTISPECIES: zinc-dependent alcohol dehydrogenase [Rhodococcus]ETT23656.1 Alcohol dehydrogenase GroES domain protein [Rhodococcus rhodochrous ATCC 21198]AKE91563.1 alcohol dehydrogenase [Rhodococcus aetherivorans]KDE10597.1 alcohol dehydrogenase [Rhodococcus aetherivorans]MBC2589396.1 glutathione-dependent formaldehyde dehydrogenase [Rhodococcus aetherivorans]NGP29788.1 glutathione-dependent formaldehyde dehydrogenase [Rhodococcus aetherivorans]
MRALCWMGVNDLSVETVEDPKLLNPHDVIVEVRLTTTCGSDLHFIDGYLPGMREGDVFGHEFMGDVVEKGAEVTSVNVGDRVVVPSFIGCGACWYCDHDLYSACDTTNPNAAMQQPLLGYPSGGIYGYTHPFGGYQGSHAQYVRVPFGDVNCFPIPEGITDEQALFLSDAVPTGYMGADFCDISPGDTVAVWGAGGVGLMAAVSARILGAERVIVVDRLGERLDLAARLGLETIDYSAEDSMQEALRESTGGRGPDACIEAVGMEAHGTGLMQIYDRVKQALRMETDRATPLRQAIMACRKGGVVSVLGVYGLTDKFPMGLLTNKSLTLRTAQQHGQRYVPRLFEHVQAGKLDPSLLITHDMSLEDSVRGYEMFKDKKDGCVRAVFRP